MMDNVLGITPEEPGFSRTLIRPDLLDLDSAQGDVPSPHGPIHVELKKTNGKVIATLDLPEGTQTRVLFPVAAANEQVFVNDQPLGGRVSEEGKRKEIQLGPGHFILHAR